jgi:ferredoxin hydrogenase small subunit
MGATKTETGMALNVVWLQSGGCGGCSMSLLCADTPDLPALLQSNGINLLWHPALSLQGEQNLIDLLEDCLSGRVQLDVLCLEGALLRGPKRTGRFHLLAGTGLPMMDWVGRLAKVTKHVLAIGSCAAWGGITASGNNPSEACGLQYEDEHKGGLLGAHFVDRTGLPVINVAGCPTHPGWVIDTLALLAAKQLTLDDLDALGRPRFYADQLVHHACPRNEYYEYKASAAKPTDLGCLMENLGCKGTQANADCNTRLWNGDGSCLRGGFACINCTAPGFQSPGHAFHTTPKLAGIPVGLPTDMPKAWFVALASLSKSATPKRVKINAHSDHVVVPPAPRTKRQR